MMRTEGKNDAVLIFAGTTEGRILAEYASEHAIPCFVSVATQYGKSLIDHLKNVTVLTGRMDAGEMKNFIETHGIGLVIDATHPFASEVTKNIRTACVQAGQDRKSVKYVRCLRKTDCAEPQKNGQGIDVVYVSSVPEAVKFLEKTEGNVLIATGSKELHCYTGIENYRERCFARVLSTPEAVSHSAELGFEGKHLIAMQGPFSAELNLALLHQVKASYFVTKETGKAGGFEEKEEAAARAGAVLVVIGRPEETGEDLKEIQKMLLSYYEEYRNADISV